MYHYGGDAGEFPHDGNFCLDGLVYPDRRPHTGLLEYGNVLRPVRAEIESISGNSAALSFRNYFDFRSLSCIKALYTIKEHGQLLGEGSITLSAAAGGMESQVITLPELGKGDAYINIFYCYASDEPLVSASTILGFDQLKIKDAEDVCASAEPSGLIKADETEKEYIILGEGFEYRIDKRRAVFTSIVAGGKERLASPMEWTLWRSPTDNDRKIKREWKEMNYDRAESRAVKSEMSVSDNLVVLSFDFHLAAVSLQHVGLDV